MCLVYISTAGNFPFVLAGNAQRSNEVKMRRGRRVRKMKQEQEKKARRGGGDEKTSAERRYKDR
jgi:hypothetical protein